jgi:GNAT superfamily N-acetyltransferase
VAGDAVIRELRQSDAEAVARLLISVNPHQIATAESVWYRATRGIERERRREWVAEACGDIVGSAQAGFEWAVPTPGKGRFWIGVHPERRGRGIGGSLYREVEKYLLGNGAVRLRSWVDADPGGERFLRKRGFERRSADRVSVLDPREADLSALPRLEAERAAEGFRVTPLGDVLDQAQDLHGICVHGELDMPSDEPETEVDFDSWRREELDHPGVSPEGSMVVLAGERPVSLAFLGVDPARRLGYNSMTATLREYRRRGLALLAKLEVLRWARETGLERILTENDTGNTGMLAINERLGYRPLYEQHTWVLDLSERKGASSERG